MYAHSVFVIVASSLLASDSIYVPFRAAWMHGSMRCSGYPMVSSRCRRCLREDEPTRLASPPRSQPSSLGSRGGSVRPGPTGVSLAHDSENAPPCAGSPTASPRPAARSRLGSAPPSTTPIPAAQTRRTGPRLGPACRRHGSVPRPPRSTGRTSNLREQLPSHFYLHLAVPAGSRPRAWMRPHPHPQARAVSESGAPDPRHAAG